MNLVHCLNLVAIVISIILCSGNFVYPQLCLAIDPGMKPILSDKENGLVLLRISSFFCQSMPSQFSLNNIMSAFSAKLYQPHFFHNFVFHNVTSSSLSTLFAQHIFITSLFFMGTLFEAHI